MAEKTLTNVRILQATKTTAQWAEVTKILDRGLLCIEMTEDNQTLAKVGDGSHTYAQLPYIGTAQFDLSNFYTRSETDAAIAAAVDDLQIGNVTLQGVHASSEDLPASGNQAGDMYFVGPKEGTTDEYDQYVWTANDEWINLGVRGSTEIDLSDYVTHTEFDAVKQAIDLLKAENNPHENRNILDLITAPFTTELETKLNSITTFTGAIAADVEQEIEAAAGTSGLVPAPAIGDEGKFLKGDGTWAEIAASYDDTALVSRIEAIEEDYIKSVDDLTLQCSV